MAPRSTGETIKVLRGLREISASELGRRSKCAGITIRRIEAGEQDPSVSVLRRILDALEADDQVRLGLLK